MDCMVRKKNIVYLIFTLVSCLLVENCLYSRGHVHRDEELFLQGQSYYQKGEYEQALACYTSMKHPGRAVFYNRGNCYKYMNKPVEALVSWHRAQKGATYKEYDALKAAMDDLKKEVGSSTHAKSLGKTVRDYFNRLYVPFSLGTLQIILLFLWYAFFLLIRYYKRSVFLFLCLLSALAGIFLVGSGVLIKYQQMWYPYAVVRVETGSLHAGPDSNYHVLLPVRLADELRVREKIPGWCRVELYNGVGTGWIEESAIEIVE